MTRSTTTQKPARGRKASRVVVRQLTVEEHAALLAGLPRQAELDARKFQRRGGWAAPAASKIAWVR